MGGLYAGMVSSITPSTSDDNWTLDDTGNSAMAYIKEFWWGGEATSSTAMHTKVARSGSAAGAGTAGDVQQVDEGSETNRVAFYTTYATTQPTLDPGALWAISWNANGGTVRWAHAVGFRLVNETVSCRNSVGTATSSYGVHWQE